MLEPPARKTSLVVPQETKPAQCHTQPEPLLWARLALDAAELGVWRCELAHNTLHLDERAQALTGLASPTTLAALYDRIHTDDVAALKRANEEALDPLAGNERYSAKCRIVHVDGTVRWIAAWSRVHFSGEGAQREAVYLVGTMRDITEMRAARQALEAARESALNEANRLARARSEFLANMSHEIRTPLNAVLGLAQTGMRDNAGRRSVATFQRILDSGQQLLGVINDVLDYAKIEAGKVTLERIAFAPGDAIDRAVDLLAQQAYAKGLAFTVDEAPDLPATCYGDVLRVSQILLNLLSNAVKFTERGEIVLGARCDGDGIVLEVSDTGVGMSAEVIERLFRPFEQADASTTRRFGGTGLGLTITRRLIDLMGGTIAVHSRPGEGSRFSVRLPTEYGAATNEPVAGRVRLVGLRTAEARHLLTALGRWGIDAEISTPAEAFAVPCDLVLFSASGADNAALMNVGSALRSGRRVAFVQTPGEADVPFTYLDALTPVIDRPLRARQILGALRGRSMIVRSPTLAAPRLQGVRVLAAEDSEVNRVVLEDMLKGEGVVLTLVENGRLAVEQLRVAGADAYDVVLTDIHMPELDGYQTAHCIHEIAPQLPVIGVTARSMADESERCLAAGMVAHVAKPIDLETLIAAIRKHCVQLNSHTHTAAISVLPVRDHVAAAGVAAAAIINWPRLEIRYRGRRALIDKLIAASLRNHAKTAEQLRNAAACRDFETVAALAHTLKGIAGNFVAESLDLLAGEIEELARQRNERALSQTAALAALADQLFGELSEPRKSA